MELIQVAEKTYYIKNPTNIGVYKIDEENVYLIDTGNDKDTGKKVLKIMEEKGWKVKGIFNTHSHADHIGGNKIIEEKTGCSIFAPQVEKSFIENPILEPTFLYGAYPFKPLQNKQLLAKPSNSKELESHLPEGLESIELKGHSFSMVGIKTSDNVYFLGDALFSKETIEKYHVFYLHNVKECLHSLEIIEKLQGKLYIPSHAEPRKDIIELLLLNRQKIEEIISFILLFCQEKIVFETLLQKIFTYFNLSMNETQYVLVGSTIKAYLTYLYEQEKINYCFFNNQMFWQTIN